MEVQIECYKLKYMWGKVVLHLLIAITILQASHDAGKEILHSAVRQRQERGVV